SLPWELPALVDALAVWATEESIGPLVELVGHGDRGIRIRAMATLGNFKPPPAQAAEPIARRLSDFADRREASRALQALGPVAEKAGMPLLDSSDRGVPEEACNILKVIGTRESLDSLNKVASGRDPRLKRAAQAAIQEIMKRT